MPRIARPVVKGEPAVYHVICRSALDGFALGDVEKEHFVKLLRELGSASGSPIKRLLTRAKTLPGKVFCLSFVNYCRSLPLPRFLVWRCQSLLHQSNLHS